MREYAGYAGLVALVVTALAATLGLVLKFRETRDPAADVRRYPSFVRRGVEVVRAFFLAEESPFNLAFARIWFFAVLPFLLPAPSRVAGMAALPPSLQFPPDLLGWVVADLGLTPAAIRVLWWVILAGCVLAVLGVFTRTAALAVTLGVFLYLGELQLYGKVQHIHHLLWIAAVFVVAPSADALSLSTLGRGLRGHLPVTAVPRSRAYAWPLRAIWLSIGLVYLFPGLAKAIVLNLRWLETSTLQNHMWRKWIELGGYRPFIRVDESEALLFMGAAGTLVFELGFLLLMFTRSTRHIGALAGLTFHNATNLVMRIPFWHLQAMYPLLVDWEWISERVFALRKSLTILYDRDCRLCRRSVSTLQRWLIPGSVTFVDARDQQALDRCGVPRELRGQLVSGLHLWDGARTWTGFAAYRRVFRRQPWAWLFLPFLYLRPARIIGDRAYGRMVSQLRQAPEPERQIRGRTPSLVPVLGLTVPLLVAIFLAGASRQTSAWPVAEYPEFAYVPDGTTPKLRFEVANGRGPRRELAAREVFPLYGPTRLASLARSLASWPEGRTARRQARGPQATARRQRALQALSRAVASSQRGRYTDLWVIADEVPIAPGEQGRVVRSRTLVHVRSDGSVSAGPPSLLVGHSERDHRRDREPSGW